VERTTFGVLKDVEEKLGQYGQDFGVSASKIIFFS
jgi:hypothetical protein